MSSRAVTDPDPFDLTSSIVHLGLGATAVPVRDFTWSAEDLASYEGRFGADGDEGRMVVMGHSTASWTSWERHPAGEEVVVQLSGRAVLIQEIDGVERRTELGPGQAIINPPGVWHTCDVREPGDMLFITPGRGTEHRPR
jgi:quercetin dioxygenase-like cupin family protein